MAWIFGGDIFGARLLNTFIALAIALLIYFGGRAILGCLPAFFGALLFLSSDQAVIHFRWVYPHNAVALGFTITTLALLRSSRPPVDWTAGLGLAIGALSHPLFVHGAAAAWACRIKRPQTWLRLVIPATIVLASTIGLSLVHYWPHLWVFQDMATLVEFYRDFNRENAGAWQAPRNIAVFYSHDLFHFGSLVAILLCCSAATLSHRDLCWHGVISPFAKSPKPARLLLSGDRFAADFSAGVGRRVTDDLHLVEINLSENLCKEGCVVYRDAHPTRNDAAYPATISAR